MTAANESADDGREAGTALEPCAKGRILIADDERSVREVFRKVVAYGLPNCRADIAVNGAEAVEIFRSVHHQVILTDVRMPVMDGEQAFQEIRKICQESRWEMPSVIFCTGFVPPHGLKNIVAGNPAHCIIQKPVDNVTLLEAIKLRLGVAG